MEAGIRTSIYILGSRTAGRNKNLLERADLSALWVGRDLSRPGSIDIRMDKATGRPGPKR